MVNIKLDLFDERKYVEDLLKIKKVYKKDDTKLLRKLFKKINQKGKYKNFQKPIYIKNNYTKNSKYDNTFPHLEKQMCMIKFRYGNDTRSHKMFLQTYMPQENKEEVLEKPKYFGDDLASYEANLTKKHFKFIISPDNQNVDLKVLTTQLVKQMNSALGFDFRWIAVEHNDTAHKHVHLLINNKDKNGRYINRIDRDFLSHTMRKMACEICTKMVGYRSKEEIASYKNKEHLRCRITNIDKVLKKESVKDYQKPDKPYHILSAKNEIQRRRLDYLLSIGLGKKEKNKYILDFDWYETLEATGRYNTFLEARKKYSNKNKAFRLYNNEDIKGKVLKIYNMNDEDVWNNAAIIETEKTIFYVNSYTKVKRKLLNQAVEVKPKTNARGLKSINISQI